MYIKYVLTDRNGVLIGYELSNGDKLNKKQAIRDIRDRKIDNARLVYVKDGLYSVRTQAEKKRIITDSGVLNSVFCELRGLKRNLK